MVNLTNMEESISTSHHGKPAKELAQRIASLMGSMIGQSGLKRKGTWLRQLASKLMKRSYVGPYVQISRLSRQQRTQPCAAVTNCETTLPIGLLSCPFDASQLKLNKSIYPTLFFPSFIPSSFSLANDAYSLMVSQRAIQNQSNRDDEKHFSEDQVLRHAAMMPRIIRFLFIISLQPIMPLRDFYARSIGHHSSSDLHDPLAYADLRVDRLHSNDNIILPQPPKELIRKPINDHYISRFDSRLHRHPIRIAGRDEVLLNDVVGSNDGDYSKVGQYVFEHQIQLIEVVR